MGSKNRIFIAKPDTWFKAGTVCSLDEENEFPDGIFHGDSAAGIFEGIHVIEEGEQGVKYRWVGLEAGTEVEDRELCHFDEFDIYEAGVDLGESIKPHE